MHGAISGHPRVVCAALFSPAPDLSRDELHKLPGDLQTLLAVDDVVPHVTLTAEGGELARRRAERTLRNDAFFSRCRAPAELTLKIGAQVMLLWNTDLVGGKKLVNGSRGKVVGWTPLDDARAQLEAERRRHGRNSPERARITARLEALDRLGPDAALPAVAFYNGRMETVWPEEFRVTRLGLGDCVRVQRRCAWPGPSPSTSLRCLMRVSVVESQVQGSV